MNEHPGLSYDDVRDGMIALAASLIRDGQDLAVAARRNRAIGQAERAEKLSRLAIAAISKAAAIEAAIVAMEDAVARMETIGRAA